MKTFDYIQAWHYVARPAYDVLPANVRQLFRDTARIAKDLHQDRACAMIWPSEEMYATVDGAADFRERFDKTPAEWLALGAHVINFLGHWKPGKEDTAEDLALGPDDLAACAVGSWKFAHYADQSLRARLGINERGQHTTYPNGSVHLEIHDGCFRVCYGSEDTWSWEEVAPATAEGKARAEQLANVIRVAIGAYTDNRRNRRDRDDAAHKAIDRVRVMAHDVETWPDSWRPWVCVAERYMVEEGQQGIPSLVNAKRTRRMQAKIDKMPAEYEAGIAKHDQRKRTELAGRLFWLERVIDDENLIYYDHTGTFSFGWRHPMAWDLVSAILEHASEFPYKYEIKVAPCTMYPHGTKLEGGQE